MLWEMCKYQERQTNSREVRTKLAAVLFVRVVPTIVDAVASPVSRDTASVCTEELAAGTVACIIYHMGVILIVLDSETESSI